MPMTQATAGEYYVCFEPRIGCWVAWQLLQADRRGVVLVALDWFGSRAPETNELVELTDAELLGGAVRSYGPPPPGATKVGTGALRLAADTRFAENWSSRAQVRAFRERQTSDVQPVSESAQMVTLEGATFTHPLPGHSVGDPVRVSEAIRDFSAEYADYAEHFDVAQFARLSGLATLDLNGAPEPIAAMAVEQIARSCRGLMRLTIPRLASTASVLDLRDSKLRELVVDPSGLEAVLLPDTIEKLTLQPGTEQASTIRIETPQDGAELELVITGEVPQLSGVAHLRLLHVDEIDNLDVTAIARDLPGLRAMHLWGNPGYLRNIQALAGLVELHTLWIQDLFGWSAEEWPGTDAAAMPSLRALLVKSAPADVVKASKALMQRRDNAWTDLGSPRSAEWLAENLENPLRHWGDDPRIRAVEAKRATALYVDCLRQARALGAQRSGESESTLQPILDLARSFVDGINAINAKRGFMDTADREDGASALENLCDAAGATRAEREQAMSLGDALGDD